jgi:hypothetical protein
MRESASRMREHADAGAAQTANRGAGAGTIEAEQQIARALDRVVEKLGGSAGAEAGRLAEAVDRTRDVRERLNELERQIRQREARERGREQGGPRAQQGRGGQSRSPGGDTASPELQRLRDEYARELQRARQSLGRMDGEQRNGTGMATPERQEFSRSAPGTEAFKQDFAGWESLRKEIDLALEKYEAAVSARLARKLTEDRLSAGGSDRVPDAYARRIARYYESLAKRP